MDTAPGEFGPPPVEKLTQADQWQRMTASQRAKVKAGCGQAGIKLFVSALGSRETPLNSNDTAASTAKWFNDYGVDGVDVDYEVISTCLVGHKDAQIPLEKIVIGKPATDATYLSTYIKEASHTNWTTGIMFWKVGHALQQTVQKS
ncbi:hypothetical protein DFH09DRAFT_1309939 [Mycena vulgaris]|nr:hypothetical protein DFH09DRAFT_1309939 [Mycena vulgaris]